MDINIVSGKDALTKHSIGKFHQQKIQSLSKQPTLQAFAKSGLPFQMQLDECIKESTFLYM
jgi:hypothetical protein